MCYWPLDIFYEVPIHDFCRFLNLLHFCFLMTYRSCLHTMDTLLKITLKISPPPMSGVCFHPLKGEVPNCNEGEFINLFSMVDHFCVHLSNLCLRLGCIPHWDFFSLQGWQWPHGTDQAVGHLRWPSQPWRGSHICPWAGSCPRPTASPMPPSVASLCPSYFQNLSTGE